MKKFIQSMMLIAALLVPWALQAQSVSLEQYLFSTGTDATRWMPVTSTTSLITPGAGDHGVSTVQDIGFSFFFAGSSYTQFSVNADGNLRLGSTVTGTSNYTTPFSSSNASVNNPKINPMGCDGYLSDSGYVYKQVFGTAPDRVCVVEFATSTYNNSSRASLLRWQVQLYESGDFQIVFHSGQPPILPAVTRQCGVCVNASDVMLIGVDHQATHYTSGSSTTIASGNWPDANRYYRFTAPTCLLPLNLAVAATSDQAVLTWNGDTDASHWLLTFNNQTTAVYTTSDTLSNLTPATHYTGSMRTVCTNGDTSAAGSFDFTTSCVGLTSSDLPWNEDFEDYSTGTSAELPPCWTRYNDATGTYNYYPYIYNSATYAHSGTNCLYFYGNTTSTYANQQAMVLPAINTTDVPMNTLEMLFWARGSSTSSYLSEVIVGVVGNLNDPTSFVPVDTLDFTSTLEQYTVSFANYTGTGNSIAIAMVRGSSTNYAYIDDITIRQYSSCPTPEDVYVATVSSDEATLAWSSASGVSSWTVYYGGEDFDATEASALTVYDTMATLTDLEPDSVYQFYVEANCNGGEVSNPSFPLTFHTSCIPVSSYDLPYEYSFDDATGSGAAYAINSCWTRYTSYSTAYPYPSSSQSHTGNYSLYFYSNTTAFSAASLPLFESPLNTLQLTFWAYKTSANYGKIMVGVMSNPSDMSTFDTLVNLQVSETSHWEYFEVPLNNYTGTGGYIALVSPVGAISYTYVDDVTVNTLPTCQRPTNLAATNVTPTSADITWTDNNGSGSSAYILEYGPAGFTPGNGISMAGSGTTAHLTDLVQGSEYEVYLYADCGSGDTSSFNVFTFFTECATLMAANLPLYEDFESYTTGAANPIDHCWTKGTNSSTNYPYPYTTAAINGSLGLYFYSTTSYYSYAAMPQVDLTVPLSSLVLEFNAKRYSSTTSTYHSEIVVGVMSDPTDITTFDTVQILDYTSSAASSIHAATVSFASYTGTGRYIAFYAPMRNTGGGTNYIYIDDVVLYVPSSCPTPENAAVTAVTSDSVYVKWDDNDQVDSWELYFGAPGFDLSQMSPITVSDTTIAIGDLEPDTEYEFCVRAVCTSENSNPSPRVQFHTPCLIAIDALPYYENFDDWSAISSCWDYTPSKLALYTTTTYLYGTSGKSLRFYGSTNNVVVLPLFEEELQNLSLSFMTRPEGTSASAGNFDVGYVTNAADISTFVALATYNYADFDGEYQPREVTFAYAPANARIAFRHRPSSTSWYWFIDEVTVDYPAPCQRPADLTVVETLPDSVLLSWTDPVNSDWVVVVGEPGFEPDTAVAHLEYVSDTFAYIGYLLPDHLYEAYVGVYCQNDTTWSFPVEFRTACTPVATSALPYTENFESYGSGSDNPISSCWTKGTNASAAYPYPYSTNAVTGSRSLYFYGYYPSSTTTSPYYSYAAMPLFENALADLELNFKMKRYNSTSAYYTSLLILGVMTNPNEISTFDTIAVYDMQNEAGNTVWDVTAYFDSYEGTGRYIAFLVPPLTPWGSNTYSYNYVYLDDVQVSLVPDCRVSTDLAVDSVSSHEAWLSWHNGSTTASEYQVAYSDVYGFNPDTCSSVVATYDTTAQLSNLASYHSYYWCVRALCGTDTGAWSSSEMLITEVDCGDGYIHVVDTLGDGTSSSTTYAMYTSTSYDAGYNTNIFSAAEMGAMGVVDVTNINSISLQSASSQGIIPRVQIFMKETSQSDFGTAADSIPVSTMTLVYDGPLTIAAGSWNTIIFDTPFTYSGTQNLAVTMRRSGGTLSSSISFYYNSTSPEYSNLYGYRSSATAAFYGYRTYNRPNVMFDFCTYVPACPRPTDVTVSSVGAHTASLSWSGTADSYEYYVTTTAGEPAAGTVGVTVTDTTVALQGLTENSDYYFYVRGHCGSDVSSWSFVAEFHTACEPMTLPFTEDFESYTSGSTAAFSTCWTKGTNSTTAYPYPYTTAAINGDRGFYFYGYQPSSASTTPIYSYAALPQMDAPVSSLMLNFNMKRYNSTSTYHTSRLVVGVMTNPANIETFVPVDTIDLYNEPSGSVTNVEVLFNGYQGNGQYIALYDEVPPLYGSNTYTYSYVYVDDILVDYIPTCRRPENVAASGVTATGATISWTPGSVPANGYEIEYGPAGFQHGQGTVVAAAQSPYTLAGLSPSMNYDVYVRALCSADDTSYWSASASVQTLCGAIQLPYSYNFDNDEAGTSAPMAHCWTRINDATGTSNYYPYVYSSTTYASSGSNCLYFYSSTTTSYADNMYAVTPGIDTVNFPMNRVQISFYGRSSSTSASTIEVGLMTDPDDTSTFVSVESVMLNSEGTVYTVSFEDYTGYGSYIAIKMSRHASTAYAYIDDILIEPTSPCPMPANVQVVSTTVSAVVSWTNPTSTQWNLEYGLHGFTPGSGTAVNNLTQPNYTITGLTPVTAYDVYITARCANNEMSFATLKTFSTTQTPATVPYSYNFEDGAEWANWQSSSNTGAAWYRGTAVAGQGTQSLYISTTQGATYKPYSYNAIVNSVVYRDIDFGSIDSSFTLTLKARVGGTVDHNYDGLSILVMNSSDYVESFNTALTSPWGHLNDLNRVGVIRLDTVWDDYSFTIDHVSGVHRLAFYWYNQNTGSNNAYLEEPAAIDDIQIEYAECARPYDVTITNIDHQSATIGWGGPSTANYEVIYRPYPTGTVSDNITLATTGNVITLTGLTERTQYAVWIRKYCDATTVSPSTSGYLFSTTGMMTPLPVNIDFEDSTAYPGLYLVNGSNANAWVVGSAANYDTTGADGHALYVSNDNGTSNDYSATSASLSYAYLDVQLEQGWNYYSFDWLCKGESSFDYIRVALVPSDVQLEAATALPTGLNSTSLPSGWISLDRYNKLNLQENWQHLNDSIELPESGVYHFTFVWRNDGSVGNNPAGTVDNIQIWNNGPLCGAPEILYASHDYSSASFTWSGNGVSYEYAVKAATEAVWPAENATTQLTAILTGLYPATEYQFRVRQICDSAASQISEWSEYAFTTDSMPCSVPTDLTAEVSYRSATLDWTSGNTASAWEVRVWNSAVDTIYEVAAHPATIGGLAMNTQYNVSVNALCGGGIVESGYGDTLSITTLNCEPVTNLSVANVTSNSAAVSWNGHAASYDLEYGPAGFQTNTGTLIEGITGTSYTLTGLEDDYHYAVSVRAHCDATTASSWADAVDFTTEPVGIATIDGAQVSLYPNPATATTTVTLKGVSGEVTLTIVDLNGRTVMTETMSCEGGCTKTLEVSHLLQGAYFVRLSGESVNAVKKLVVK